MRTFEPTNESADCWSAAHSYNFIIRIKLMQQIKSILIGWGEPMSSAYPMIKYLGFVPKKP